MSFSPACHRAPGPSEMLSLLSSALSLVNATPSPGKITGQARKVVNGSNGALAATAPMTTSARHSALMKRGLTGSGLQINGNRFVAVGQGFRYPPCRIYCRRLPDYPPANVTETLSPIVTGNSWAGRAAEPPESVENFRTNVRV